MVEIWEAKLNREYAKELPIVIPFVTYHGASNWHILTNLRKMLSGYEHLSDELKVYVPNFEYILYDLSTYNDEDIKGAAQTRILLMLLRDIFAKNRVELMQSIERAIHYLTELDDKQTGLEYFETMLRYIYSSAKDFTKKEPAQMIKQFEKGYPKGSDITMTLADMWREEGIVVI